MHQKTETLLTLQRSHVTHEMGAQSEPPAKGDLSLSSERPSNQIEKSERNH